MVVRSVLGYQEMMILASIKTERVLMKISRGNFVATKGLSAVAKAKEGDMSKPKVVTRAAPIITSFLVLEEEGKLFSSSTLLLPVIPTRLPVRSPIRLLWRITRPAVGFKKLKHCGRMRRSIPISNHLLIFFNPNTPCGC